MALTPRQEAMHLEVRALLELKPKDPEALYIYNAALEQFLDIHAQELLNILDKYFSEQISK